MLSKEQILVRAHGSVSGSWAQGASLVGHGEGFGVVILRRALLCPLFSTDDLRPFHMRQTSTVCVSLFRVGGGREEEEVHVFPFWW